MDRKIKKVAFLTNIPRPYRVAFLNYCYEFLEERNIRLKVLFYSSLKEYPDRREKIDEGKFKFEFEYLDYKKVKIGGRSYFFVKNLNKIAESEKLDVIIVGNMSSVLYQVSKLDIKKVLYSGSFNEYGFFKTFFRKTLLKKIDSIISYSSVSREYFKSLGFPQDKIFIATNSVDNDFFKIKNFNEKRFDKLKILYCGKLNRRKGVHIFPKIFNKIKFDFEFHIVGDGELRDRLEKTLLKGSLKNKIFFHGFLQPEEVKILYHNCNLFFFPSFKDPWGLVVNEAMLGGMAILSSVHAGVTYDLIFDNTNGFRIDPEDIDGIVEKLNYLNENMEKLREFGKNSLKIVTEKSGFKIMSKDFYEAVIS